MVSGFELYTDAMISSLKDYVIIVFMKLQLVLHNIRSAYNVGAILRTAEGLGVEKVVFSGYTPRYEDTKLLPHLREKLDCQIAKAALGAETMVAQETVEDLPVWLEQQRAEGWLILGLENNLAAEEMPRKLLLGESVPASRAVLVLGEEVHGIPSDVRKQCDYFLEIPMTGRKESFNVSVATGIAVWGLMSAKNG